MFAFSSADTKLRSLPVSPHVFSCTNPLNSRIQFPASHETEIHETPWTWLSEYRVPTNLAIPRKAQRHFCSFVFTGAS